MGIYSKLCTKKSTLKESYKPGSGLHRHHIVPKHSGGTDEESNFTYLTPREHVLAHFLLWKIHQNPNDLRSMRMLGAKLSIEYRKTIGFFCRDYKIGFYGAPDQLRKEWSKKGAETQINQKIGIHTPGNYSKFASIGGKASIKSSNNPWSYWASPEGRKERARMGAEAIKGRKVMYKPGDITFKRIKPEEVEKYLKLGYIYGSPINPHDKKKKKRMWD